MTAPESAPSTSGDPEKKGLDAMLKEFAELREDSAEAKQMANVLAPIVAKALSQQFVRASDLPEKLTLDAIKGLAEQVSKTHEGLWRPANGYKMLFGVAGLALGFFGALVGVNYISNERLVEVLKTYATDLRNESNQVREDVKSEINHWRELSQDQLDDFGKLTDSTAAFVDSQKKEFAEMRAQFKEQITEIDPVFVSMKDELKRQLDIQEGAAVEYRELHSKCDGIISTALVYLSQAKDELFSRGSPGAARAFVVKIRECISELKGLPGINALPASEALVRSLLLLEAECAFRIGDFDGLKSVVGEMEGAKIADGRFYHGIISLQYALDETWASPKREELLATARDHFQACAMDGSHRFADVFVVMIWLELGAYRECYERCIQIEAGLLNQNAALEQTLAAESRSKLLLVRCIGALAEFAGGHTNKLGVFDCVVAPGSVDAWNSLIIANMLTRWIRNRSDFVTVHPSQDAECLGEEFGLYCVYLLGTLQSACLGELGMGCEGCGSAVAQQNPNTQELLEPFAIRVSALWPKPFEYSLAALTEERTFELHRMVSYQRVKRRVTGADGTTKEVDFFIPKVEAVKLTVPKRAALDAGKLDFQVPLDYWVSGDYGAVDEPYKTAPTSVLHVLPTN